MKKFFLAISIILLSTIQISCSDNTYSDNNNKNNSTENKKLIVGTSADNPPYDFISKGEISGFDMDLIALIASELHKELIIKNLDFSGLLPAILSGNVDILIAGLSYNEKRAENVDFSTPYITTQMSVLYSPDFEITNIADLAGKKIGVQIGTDWAEYANKLAEKYEGIEIKILTNNLILIQELNNKNIDAVILEDIQVKKFKEFYPNLKKFDIEDTKSDFVIALAKNSELTEKINQVLKKLNEEGKIEELKNKWLK